MRVKKQFLEKKIDKYRDYIKHIPSKEDNLLKIFDITIMLNVLRWENYSIGDYILFEDDTHYNTKTLEFYNTGELYKFVDSRLMGKSLEGDHPDWAEVIRRFPVLKEIGKIKYSYLQQRYLEQIQLENDNRVAQLINKNKNVIYMRDNKFLSEYGFETSMQYRLSDIPLEKFVIFTSYDINEIRETDCDFLEVVSGVFEFYEINKNNMDDILNDFFCDDKGYIKGMDREAYDHFYNNLYNGKERMFFVNYKIHFPSHYLERNYISNGETTMWLENITNGEMQITESEYILYGFEKRLAYICNYFKNLEDFEEIDLRVFNEVKKAEGVKGHRKIEERVSTVVKSHIRRYKSGLKTIVRSYVRKGINQEGKGVCVTL
ncbi:MAG: hypothetical protein ACRCYT_09455 [Cetobacterium sp.]